MDFQLLIDDTKKQLAAQRFVEFSKDHLYALRLDQVQAIVDEFHGRALMKIPQTEIDFFTWLKKNDPDIWDDLWQDEDDMYLVSIDLLSRFIDGGLGFPICDLVNQPNYWFNVRPSNTEPLLRLNLEANSIDLLEQSTKKVLEIIRG